MGKREGHEIEHSGPGDFLGEDHKERSIVGFEGEDGESDQEESEEDTRDKEVEYFDGAGGLELGFSEKKEV